MVEAAGLNSARSSTDCAQVPEKYFHAGKPVILPLDADEATRTRCAKTRVLR